MSVTKQCNIEGNNSSNYFGTGKAERYLTSIKSSHDTSYQVQLKRTIASLFEKLKLFINDLN